MVSTWRDYGEPAGVAGMIMPRYQSPPSAFVRAGGFFVRALYPTGTELHAYPTSNLLLDVSFLEAHGLGFNQRLGMHGGEDTLLTSAVTRLGGRIVACRESEVFDLVPDARNNREWVLSRARHIGVSHSVIELVDVPPGPRRLGVRARAAAGGLARAAVGGLKAVGGRVLMLVGPAAERGLGTYARGLRMMNRGLGMVRGALPGVAPQYRRDE